MKSWKRIAVAVAAVALSASLVFSATACSGSSSSSTMSTIEITEANLDYWAEQCEDLYDSELGEFYELYTQAKAASDVDEKYALMALAEAKLLESAVMLPSTSSGGNWAISKVAPHTYPTVGWGTDSDRYHQAVVADSFITTTDRAAINSLYQSYLNTGSDFENKDGATTTAQKYSAEVKDYLTEAGYGIQDSYSYVYSSNGTTFDILGTARAVNSEILVNTYDGLVEYDELGNLQYALADDIVEVKNSDGTYSYYFHIRDGVKWYTRDGSEYGDVSADDFVAGFQHMLDGGTSSALYTLVYGIVDGVDDYMRSSTKDFSVVGVKAGTYSNGTFTAATSGDTTAEWVAYTLETECTYFYSMLTYNEFAPMNRTYFTSQGGDFGTDYAPTADTYTYGSSVSNILYCGPYLIENYTADSTIQFVANEKYWNYANINLKTITWIFSDGTSDRFSWDQLMDGSIDSAGLNDTAVQLAKSTSYGSSTYYDEFAYSTETGSTTYSIFFNINRKAYANASDGTTASTTKTESAAYKANAALQNVHFRRALAYSIDRESYNAASVGDDLALASLRNTYVPGDFVSLSSSVTVSINGTPTTFGANTYYGEIIQAQLTADGSPITVWSDPDNDDVYSTDGYDGWYNLDAAVEELEQAIAELSIDGIYVSASNPIEIDYVYISSNTVYTNRANILKQCIEEATGGCVQVNLIAVSTNDDWYDTSYNAESGYEMNFDMSDASGWGPDYQDPSTYLDTFLPDGDGYMTMMIGLWSNY